MYVYMYVYMYMYMYMIQVETNLAAPNLPANIVGFRGSDSSVILTLRGGIRRPIGDFLESLSPAMLVGCTVSRVQC